jgi:hypothetical protein
VFAKETGTLGLRRDDYNFNDVILIATLAQSGVYQNIMEATFIGCYSHIAS